MGLVDSWEASRPVVGGKLSKVRVLWFSKSGLKWDKTGEIPAYRAAFGPRHVSGGYPGRGAAGGARKGPSRGLP